MGHIFMKEKRFLDWFDEYNNIAWYLHSTSKAKS